MIVGAKDLNTYAHHMGCILRVLVYIEDHLDGSLLLEKLAEIAHISPFYFHRLFRAYMGETLADYVQRIRLQRAQERLRYSDTSITEIAMDVGYESPAAFTKVFNQIMGQSPRHYRQVMRPRVQTILKRTQPTDQEKALLKPEYLHRKEESVLFIRRTGDYKETPWQAFEALDTFLKKENISEEKIKAFYSMGLDDPQIVPRSQCRFDACVALHVNLPPQGEVGQRVLKGGRFAVFTARGPRTEIENTYDAIFRVWYPTFKDQLSDDPPFCEHLSNLDESIPENEHVTKFYIPLNDKSYL
jgi:AraC family transcriptional regulator